MGYFVQISSDTGEPLFQAVKNYPDVSFASSALFHALVTASLEQGFVPSILRAQDATIALAVHGQPGCRVSIAVVTSEFSAGQTQDVEAQLQWRLNTIYRGALVAAGGAMLRRQPKEPLRKLLGQRLAPMVRRIMSEEVSVAEPGLHGGVPRLSLTAMGTAVEWLPRVPAADAALIRLVASLPAGGGAVLAGLSPSATDGTAAAVSWQGRVLAATPAWRRLAPVDRALLVLLADEIGPATFERPTRSFALEELGALSLPSAAAGDPEALAAVGAAVGAASNLHGTWDVEAGSYRMVSIRLYPADVEKWCEPAVTEEPTLRDGARARRPVHDSAARDRARVWEEELSLVFSLVEPEEGQENAAGVGMTRAPITAADLQESADLCGASLQDFWDGLRSPCKEEQLLSCASGKLAGALLVSEASQDVVVAPSPWRMTAGLPWQSPERRRQAHAVRRLLYWLRALPPLGPQRERQYVYCEGYAVGGIRREDGLHAWGIAEARADVDGPAEDNEGCRVLEAVAEMLQQVSSASDLRTACSSKP